LKEEREATFTQGMGCCIILALLFQTVGCYSYRTIPNELDRGADETEQPTNLEQVLTTLSLAAGDKLKVELHDGQVIEGRLVSFSAPYLRLKVKPRSWTKQDEIQEINQMDVKAIHRQMLDSGKTGGLIVGILVAVAVISSAVSSVDQLPGGLQAATIP